MESKETPYVSMESKEIPYVSMKGKEITYVSIESEEIPYDALFCVHADVLNFSKHNLLLFMLTHVISYFPF
jgi:hypothetical protein